MSSDGARGVARRVLYPVVESGWGLGVRLAGRVLRPGGRTGSPPPSGGRRVVVVAPHPDDETIGAGGAAALHLLAGDPVAVVVVTDGGASRAGGRGREEMARTRAEEVREATAALGIRDLTCLALPEGRWGEGDLREPLARLLAGADLVYAPSCVDFHPEHLRVARVAAAAIPAAATVRVYELGVPLTPLLANRVVRIGEVADRKARALAAYRSQAASIAAVERLARHRARFYGAGPVEPFWEMPATAYARVMSRGDWRGSRSPYRGIRPRPLSDPLAALAGLRSRLELRRVAQDGALRGAGPLREAAGAGGPGG